MSISVLILTLNEEENLPRCLESVRWSDDVVVFDSFSTDTTCEIAAQFGARVVKRRFDNYANQRNVALNEVSYIYPWILMVDADERVSMELSEEVIGCTDAADNPISLYRMRRRDMFMGRWIKRSSGYPTWFGRLFRRGQVRVEREVNEEYHTDGKIGYLSEHLIHEPFGKGISFWFERHNRYSSMEAARLVQDRCRPIDWRGILSGDPAIRRKTLKQLAYRLPGRPGFVFAYLYFVRMGFLDGRAGLSFSLMRTCYEYMIDIKVKELRRRAQGLPV